MSIKELNSEDITLDNLKSSPSILPSFHPEYRPPEPEEVGALIRIAGLSQRKTAMLTGVVWNEKGSSTVRRWKSKRASKDYREIPYSAWRILVEFVGLSTSKDAKQLLNKIDDMSL